MTDFIIKKRYYRARKRIIDILQKICGYSVNLIITPEVKKVFDFSCDSPFLEREKDSGLQGKKSYGFTQKR